MRTFDLSSMPESLQRVVTTAWTSIDSAVQGATTGSYVSARLQALPKSLDDQFECVEIAIDYAMEHLTRKPELLLSLWEQGAFSRKFQ